MVWQVGWLIALVSLAYVGLQVATAPRQETGKRWLGSVVYGLVVAATLGLAQFAIVNNDNHLDLTRNKAFTPHQSVVELIDSLEVPVALTYFGHDEDPKAKRIRVVLESLARRSSLFSVTVSDPDKDPLLARRYAVKFYNVAVVEALGHRVLASTTNELDIALAIQKSLRQKQPSVCFVSGHGELEIDNEEFHTHVESLSGGTQNHHHGHAHIPLVQTTQHGVGRLRRSLEGLGFVVLSINLTTGGNLSHCDSIAIIGPKHPYLPSEIDLLRDRYRTGTNVIVLLDLGASLPRLSAFLAEAGISFNNDVLIDEKQHHEQDIETLAVSTYPDHAITSKIAMTLFPGARSLTLESDDPQVMPLVKGSTYSVSFPLGETEVSAPHQHGDGVAHIHQSPVLGSANRNKGSPTIMAIKDKGERHGKLVVGGDADFLSNSYYPYLSNSSLAISIFRWLAGEQDEVRLEPALPVMQTIIMSQPQMRLLFLVLVIALPGAVVLFGLAMWWKTR